MGSFSLSQAIQSQVGSTSMAAMELAQPAAAQERTIETITAEIITLKTDAGNAIIGIGQRLIEAKEMLPHGQWLTWLTDQVEFSERTAQDFMRLAREWSNPQTLADLGKAKALKLLLLPAAEREDFMEAHDVPNMSTRELEQAIRERDEAKIKLKVLSEQVETLEKHNTDLETMALDYTNQNDDLKARIRELESRPIDVAVQVDEEAVKKAKAEARAAAESEWREKVKAVEDKLAKAKEKAKAAEEKAGKAVSTELDEARKAQATAEAEAETLRATLERLRADQAAATVSGDADLATFQLLFGQADADINKMHGILLKVRGRRDSDLGSKLSSALLAIAEKAKGAAT